MPAVGQVHIDAALANVAVRRPRAKGFIADRVYPVIPVRKQSDKIFKVDTEGEAFREQDDIRGPSAESKAADFKTTNVSYFCDDHSLVGFVADEEVENADAAMAPFIDRTEFLTDILMVNREAALVTHLAAVLTGGQTSSPAAKWNTYTGTPGDPITDLLTAIDGRRTAAGVVMNRVAMDQTVIKAIAEHPDFLDRCKHTLPPSDMARMGSAQLLSSLLTLDPNDPVIVEVATCIKNTAGKGATATFTPIWGENVLIYRFEPPKIGCACLGAHVVWTGANGGVSPGGFSVRRWREDRRKATATEVGAYYDQKDLHTDAGYLYTNVLA